MDLRSPHKAKLRETFKDIGNLWRIPLDILRDVLELSFFVGFSLLPASTASAIGGFLGRSVVLRWKGAVNRLSNNLRRIRPDASEHQIAAWVREFADSRGRQQAEYCVIRRLARKGGGNIRFVGTEALVERCAGKPVIFICFHTSNWEVACHSLADMGVEITGSYDPPKRRLHNWIVRKGRRRKGIVLLPVGKDAARPALQTLKNNGNLIVFCDEGFNGRVRAPFFSSPPHLQGNYAFVARLARKTNALLYPIYVTRNHGTHFTFHALEPFHLPPEDVPGGGLLEDVRLLNSVVEPIVAAHAAQWYFLGDRMPPL